MPSPSSLPAYEIVRERSGTRYRVVLTRIAGEIVVSLPDFRWSYAVWWGTPPSSDYLRARGLPEVTARDVAAILAQAWFEVAG